MLTKYWILDQILTQAFGAGEESQVLPGDAFYCKHSKQGQYKIRRWPVRKLDKLEKINDLISFFITNQKKEIYAEKKYQGRARGGEHTIKCKNCEAAKEFKDCEIGLFGKGSLDDWCSWSPQNSINFSNS